MFRRLSFLFVTMVLSAAAGQAQRPGAGPAVSLSVDAREAPRKILHARLMIPAKAGPLVVCYPKWIPGEHAPTGPIADVAQLHFRAAGKEIAWRRDLEDMYAFHVEVPPTADSIEATFDYLSPSVAEGFSAGASATPQLAVISWNQLLLYPQGAKADALQYSASLRLPAGWHFGTALEPADGQDSGEVQFKPVSLETLVDSPVLVGANFKTVDLAPGGTPPRVIDMAADSDRAVQIGEAQLGAYRSMVAEAEALFGAHHYERYHFLLSLSNHVAHFGLEHHQSSDNRAAERALIDDSLRKTTADLLPHEYVHSWNGKYRRPIDLATPDYAHPMRTDLLWIYEGLTQYLGGVLTARSGLWTAQDYREMLAIVAAHLNEESGRRWRPLIDTAVAAQLLYAAREDWSNLRRGVDFYDEGVLIWLEADTLIREKTHGTKSLDDFCRLFYGPPSGPARLKPYTLDDVVDCLNRVLPYDWSLFFTDRVQNVAPQAPLGGIAASGWRLAFSERQSQMLRYAEEAGKETSFGSSIGLVLKQDGTVTDVNPELAAGKAGIAPGMKLVSVNGRRYSSEVLRTALNESKNRHVPMSLLVDNDEFQTSYKLAYYDGERYPILERDPSKPDLLDKILAPLAR